MLDYDDFIAIVAEGAHASTAEAERAACATLRTVAERLTAGEAEDVAERLPAGLRACLDAAGAYQPFHAAEHARAVLDVLREAVGEDEFHDTIAQLPGEYRVLLRRR